MGAGDEVDGISCSFKFSAGFTAISTGRLVGLAAECSVFFSAVGGPPDCKALIRSLKETFKPSFGGCNVAHGVVVDGLPDEGPAADDDVAAAGSGWDAVDAAYKMITRKGCEQNTQRCFFRRETYFIRIGLGIFRLQSKYSFDHALRLGLLLNRLLW